MELMCTLIKLNPMIVEPHVKDILLAVSRKSLSDEEKPIYTTLISGILSMYMKLSRVPNFVSVFLTSLFVSFMLPQTALNLCFKSRI